MFKKTILALSALLLLTNCGNDWATRGGTGAGFGVGTALLMAGNPLLGAAVGAAVGAGTKQNQVDMGEPVWDNKRGGSLPW